MAIKLLNPEARFRLICEFDDALIPESKRELEALDSGQKDGNGDPITAPTRYRQYVEDLDESKLKFREGAKPSYFHFRCLTNNEVVALEEKFFVFDEQKGVRVFKGSRSIYFAEVFKLGVIGIEEDGKVAPIGPNEVGSGVVISVGAVINFYTQLGKNSKGPTSTSAAS